MKLAFLNIERFGARSQVQLEELSQQLNVVYGPNGSGKTTIIDFIRWVLYGREDTVSRRYLASATESAGGSLKIVDGDHQTRLVTRRDDGTPGGRVTVSRASSDEIVDYDQLRLTGVDLEEYQHIFSFGFDQPPAINQMVRIASARGFELTYDERQLRRVQELSDRLAELQRSYHALPESEDRLPTFYERRSQLQAEIEAIQHRHRVRLTEIDCEANELRATVAAGNARLDEMQANLQRVEDRIQMRRSQMEDVARQASQVREQLRESKHEQVEEIDQQIQQWHDVLHTVRDRLHQLQQRMSEWEPSASTLRESEESSLRLFLRTLGCHIEDIEEDLRDFSRAEDVDDLRADSEYLRSALATAIKSMRNELHLLHNEIQRHRASAAYHDHARELQRLRSCETELTELISELGTRRDGLTRSEQVIEEDYRRWYVDRSGVESAYDGSSVVRPWYVSSSHTNGSHISDHDPIAEAHLQHLTRRLDHLNLRVGQLQNEVSGAEHRLDALQASRDQLDEERQLQAVRRDLTSLEQRIQQAEQRQRCREQIDAQQREIDQLRASLGPSEIIQEASSMLHLMTEGAYGRLRITESADIWVDDADARSIAFGELSRGTRDQVYLSLGLALVAAYYRRGVELPLILNDVFVNIDSGRAQATAMLLEEFSSRGHQVILFTRHEHVLQLFPNSRGRRFKLQQRGRTVETPRVPKPHLDRVPHPDARRATTSSFSRPAERTYDWVAHWESIARGRTERDDSDEVTTPTPRQTLSEDTTLSQIDSFDPELAARLKEINVHTVRMLLNLDPEDGEERLRQFGISAATIHRCQSELTLQYYVGLTASDASLLVACGIDDPQELAYIDVSELHRRIEQYLAREEHLGRFGAITRYERSRLSRWIQSARQSRFRRGQQSRRPVGHWRSAITPLTQRTEVPTTSTANRRAEEEDEESTTEPRRFFLELSDPIVDAPSIGPKTAERFHAIGANTVVDLLDLDPDEAAEKINYRRISSELIQQWQLQTQLVCRVPNLRGHDAQILVACGFIDPAQVAEAEPRQLHDKVKRFVRTGEGKRILRNGKKPDLAEVTAWIRWSENRRRLAVEAKS